MGQIEHYACNSCDFKFDDEDLEFYFNEDLTELFEESLLMSNVKKIAMSPISGSIHISYCYDCNKFIKTYNITKNETKLLNSEIEKLVLKYSDKEDVEKIILRTEDNLIKCPICGKKIQISLADGSKCPKCPNGKLKYCGTLFLD